MSTLKNKDESKRWLMTAEDDLEAAKVLRDHKKYSHCCFQCQQAAEKVVKALIFHLDGDAWGHSVKKLLMSIKSLDADIGSELEKFHDESAVLDRFYIPTRYPNGLPDLTPADAYTRKDADEAVRIAKAIIQHIRTLTESEPADYGEECN